MLSGIRIVEVEGLGPGPFAAMHLADLGADVITVHRPGGPPDLLPDRPILDRGKRSIELDLKSADEVATFRKLVATADGLIEGFRPGVMERLGLGPQECHAFHPGLVYGRMTGWGQTGPLAARAGHDYNYLALSGQLWHASPEGVRPLTPHAVSGDVGGGALYLVIGMLAGILQARATGRGTVVDAAIVDGAAHMLNLLMTLRQSDPGWDRRGSAMLDAAPWSRTYACADGRHITVQCVEPKFYAEFLEALGLAGDPDFAAQYDGTTWPLAVERLEALFLTRPRDDWARLFDGSDACVTPVLSPTEAETHPHMAARGIWHTRDGVRAAAPAPRFDGRTVPPREAPARGAHTAEILAELRALQPRR